MEKLKSRYALVTTLMLLLALMIMQINDRMHAHSGAGVADIEKIPHRVGSWDGQDAVLKKQVFDILETRAIIHRQYTSNNRSVFLSIVHYPETKVDFHAPEACLAGTGVEITKTKKRITVFDGERDIDLSLNQLLRKKNDSHELIYYFYKAGSFLGSGYIRLRWMLALNKFSANPTSGSLIRVSTPVTINTDDAALTLKEFVQELYPHVMRAL